MWRNMWRETWRAMWRNLRVEASVNQHAEDAAWRTRTVDPPMVFTALDQEVAGAHRHHFFVQHERDLAFQRPMTKRRTGRFSGVDSVIWGPTAAQCRWAW